MLRAGRGALVALGAALACATAARAAPSVAGNWPSHGLDASETRSSPLMQIDTGNVSRLKPAWWSDLTSISTRAFEATPLVVGGRLYVSTGFSVVIAYDAATGRELWRYDPHVAKDYAAKGCCGPVSRGVAYANGRIFLGVFDGRLVSLDAATGKVRWSVLTVDPAKDYTITGAPRVIAGNVIIGNGGADLGSRGYLSAYDARTGRLVWRFYTVPGQPGHPDGTVSDAPLAKALPTWSGAWWKWGGGGTVYDAMAYDPKLGLLYVGVGNGGPWNRRIRSDGQGDNLYLSSILALKASTGEYVWHFQETPGDEWDYTATQSIILADIPIDGKVRPVLMQAPKNGFYYVLDRATGQFLSGVPYVEVTWAKGLDPVTGRPLEEPSARYSENDRPSVQQPGPLGGHNWHPMSYSPKLGLAYIPAVHAGFNYVGADRDYVVRAAAPNTGIDPLATALPEDPAVLEEARKTVYGELLAWDPVKHEPAWRVRHPVAWNGGTLVTDGGLVFQGEAGGDLAAYDARTGTKLWALNLGAGIVAPPMTYAVRGVQYIAVAVGWGGGLAQVGAGLTTQARSTGVNRLVVLKLDGTAALPAVPDPVRPPLNPPPATASVETVRAGHAIYERRCFVCHGSGAISGGEVPDLRYSAAIADAAAFRAIVRSGALSAAGMPAFGHDLDDADVERIRAYLIQRANATKNGQ